VALDSFVDRYIRLLSSKIQTEHEILAAKDFKHKSEFTKVQGRLQGFKEALQLLKSVPEDD